MPSDLEKDVTVVQSSPDIRSSPSFSSSNKNTFSINHNEYTVPTRRRPDEKVGSSHTSLDVEGQRRVHGRWPRIRSSLREAFAEYLGVVVLIIFGCGVNCQVVLGGNPAIAGREQGSYLSINLGWGIGTAMGVWMSGGISGGHINPSVTLAMATWRGFPWRKVPIYILAQILGGITGAAIVYGNYAQAINIYEGGTNVRTSLTRGLFATYPSAYLTSAGCFFSEFLGTAVMFLVVLAISDKKNGPPPAGLAPLVLFLLITGVGTSLGMQTGYAINPARDLGPRILTAIAGYGRDVFNFRHQYWLWCPVLGPIAGAQTAALVYDTFLFTGNESFLSKRFVDQHDPHPEHERQPAPNGPDAIEQ